MKHGIIYKITNRINGKVYIGKTVQAFKRRVKAGNYKSCVALNNSIKTHGWDNFDKEEFICALDQSFLAGLEEAAIIHFDCLAPKGYNIIKIDKGLNVYPESVCKKISDKAKARYAAMTEPIVAINRKAHIMIDGVAHKNCNSCKQNLTLDNFNKKSNHWDKLDNYCKPCGRKVRYRPYVRKTEEELKLSYIGRQDPEKQRQPYINNPELRLKHGKHTAKPIIGTHTITGEVIEFTSALVAKKSGFDNSEIGRAIRKGTKYKQYIWRFK